MRRKTMMKRLAVCVIVCALTFGTVYGCGPKKAEEPDDVQPVGEEVIEEDGEKADAEEVKAVTGGTEAEAPPVGEMADTETDALGNPLNDDGVYYDEDGNIVPPEEMVELDEDGNPIPAEDLMGEDNGGEWSSVEYGDKDLFAADIKIGFEELKKLPFEPVNTYYYLFANGVYEIQYEGDVSYLAFCKGRTEEEVARYTFGAVDVETVKVGDLEAEISSEGNEDFLAVWSRDGYFYSVYLDPGCSREEMTEIIASVK